MADPRLEKGVVTKKMKERRDAVQKRLDEIMGSMSTPDRQDRVQPEKEKRVK